MHLKKNNITLIAIALLIMILAACNGNTVYHQYKAVSLRGWEKSDTLCFSIALQDTNRPLHLFIETRHSEAYPYANLYLFINNDTVEYQLTNKNGKWTGIGLNAIYQNRFAYKDISLKHPDTLQIRICHGMTDKALKGISDIGICVER